MTYITFGQDHYHEVGGVVFDRNCVASIESSNRMEGRDKAFALFGNKWAFEYFNNEIKRVDVDKWFPRGIIPVPHE